LKPPVRALWIIFSDQLAVGLSAGLEEPAQPWCGATVRPVEAFREL
jgi:hypothetical protein